MMIWYNLNIISFKQLRFNMDKSLQQSRKNTVYLATTIAKLEKGEPTTRTQKLLNDYIVGKIEIEGIISQLNSKYKKV